MAERFPNVETALEQLTGETQALFTHHSRLSDITVMCSHRQFDSEFWSDVENAALFASGRPVLLVPPGPHAPNPGKVVIAWKNSLEAARAISAAQPFMTQATEVHLIAVEEGGSPAPNLRDVEAYLLLHYGEVLTKVLPASARSVGERLLEEAKRLDALLVMGAFSHWRLRERLLGGVTDDVFRKANVPVLMMR
jgi:nucleotide-binding universal stress UspA family protein